jgi:hypothetical protein
MVPQPVTSTVSATFHSLPTSVIFSFSAKLSGGSYSFWPTEQLHKALLDLSGWTADSLTAMLWPAARSATLATVATGTGVIHTRKTPNPSALLSLGNMASFMADHHKQAAPLLVDSVTQRQADTTRAFVRALWRLDYIND